MNFVYFDVETERLASEVGGWSQIEQLGLAVGVTLSSRDDQFRTYRASEAGALAEELRAADCVVGYNLQGFDLRVVQPYVEGNLLNLPCLDLMLDVKAAAGFRLKLDNLCRETLGEMKDADGVQSVQWWRDGRHEEVIAYCKQDVLLTRRLHEFGAREGFVKCRDKRGRVRTLHVPWKLDAGISVPQQGSLF